jgi:hypothetical protein
MSTRTPAAVLSLSAVTLMAAASEPIALATDTCTQSAAEMACPVEQQPPSHTPETEREPAVTAAVSTEQAPPPIPLAAGAWGRSSVTASLTTGRPTSSP